MGLIKMSQEVIYRTIGRKRDVLLYLCVSETLQARKDNLASIMLTVICEDNVNRFRVRSPSLHILAKAWH